MVSGVRSQVAVKIFGEDLATLQKLGSQIGQILTKMKGSNDLRIEQASGQNYLNIKIDRDAIARYGINVSDVNEVIQKIVSQEGTTENLISLTKETSSILNLCKM
jgi:cobalt-zinc-cadmium resistance protein CzcA